MIITCENDVLRYEGEAYAHKLALSGVTVTAIRDLGAIQDFVTLNGLGDTPAARSAIVLANAMLRQALSK